MPNGLYLEESLFDLCASWSNGSITFPLRFEVTKAAIFNTLKIDTVGFIFLLRWHFFSETRSLDPLDFITSNVYLERLM